MNTDNNYLNLTPAQKAGRTNHEHAEQRKKATRERLEESRLLRAEMNAVLKNPAATPAEKVQAAEILTKIREHRGY